VHQKDEWKNHTNVYQFQINSDKLHKLERWKESEELSGYERSKDIYMEKNLKYISEL
jgi:hypothetical protein